MSSTLQGIQLKLQSGRTRSDIPCSLHHASMHEPMKFTTSICQYILYDKQSALHALAKMHDLVNMVYQIVSCLIAV